MALKASRGSSSRHSATTSNACGCASSEVSRFMPKAAATRPPMERATVAIDS